MADAELVAIGRFAHLTGLSIHALRHYDDVGLLTPSEVDPVSGYRRYRLDQVRLARLIGELRWIDLPIEEIRRILADDGKAGDVLAAHRRRLERQRSLITAQIDDIDRFTTKGISMSTPLSGCRPVQIKIAVDDTPASIAFYQSAFDLRYDVTQRSDEQDHSSFLFGEYGQDGFFLLHLINDRTDTDRPGPTTFGLLVDDLDTRHSLALAAGGIEVVAPRDGPECRAARRSKIPAGTGSGCTRDESADSHPMNIRSCSPSVHSRLRQSRCALGARSGSRLGATPRVEHARTVLNGPELSRADLQESCFRRSARCRNYSSHRRSPEPT